MSELWVAAAVAGAGTYAFRASFLAFAHRMVDLPPMVERLLRQIPPAVLAAIILPALVLPDGEVDLAQPRLAAGIVAALVSWKTRSIAATVVVGMAVVVALEQLT